MKQIAFIVTAVIGQEYDIPFNENHCTCVTLFDRMPPLLVSLLPVCTLFRGSYCTAE